LLRSGRWLLRSGQRSAGDDACRQCGALQKL